MHPDDKRVLGSGQFGWEKKRVGWVTGKLFFYYFASPNTKSIAAQLQQYLQTYEAPHNACVISSLRLVSARKLSINITTFKIVNSFESISNF